MQRYNRRLLHPLSMSYPSKYPNIRNRRQYLQPNRNKGTYNSPLLQSISVQETLETKASFLGEGGHLLGTKLFKINILVEVL